MLMRNPFVLSCLQFGKTFSVPLTKPLNFNYKVIIFKTIHYIKIVNLKLHLKILENVIIYFICHLFFLFLLSLLMSLLNDHCIPYWLFAFTCLCFFTLPTQSCFCLHCRSIFSFIWGGTVTFIQNGEIWFKLNNLRKYLNN